MISTHHATKIVPAATPSTGFLPEDAQTRRFEAGETVFFEDDRAGEGFEVEGGVGRLGKLLPGGRRAGVGFRFARGRFGGGAGPGDGRPAGAGAPGALRA